MLYEHGYAVGGLGGSQCSVFECATTQPISFLLCTGKTIGAQFFPCKALPLSRVLLLHMPRTAAILVGLNISSFISYLIMFGKFKLGV